jgi:ATP-dependent DNA helicase RecG
MKPEFNLATPVQFLKSVGPARARGLSRLAIETVGDLLAHYPRRYFDRSSTTLVGQISVGKEVTVLGEVLTIGQRSTRRGGSQQTVTVGDDTGVLFCIWFNQRFMLKQFRAGQKVMVSGMAQRHNGRMQLVHPDFEVLVPEKQDNGPGLHTGRMVPVYGLTAGIGQHWLRALVFQALEKLSGMTQETLPADLVRARHLIPPATRITVRSLVQPPAWGVLSATPTASTVITTRW